MIEEINTLIFSGGGIRGLAFIGVFKKIQEIINKRKKLELLTDFDSKSCKIPLININSICGVSVGSAFGLIYLLNYTYIEMLEIALTKKFTELNDIKIMDFISQYGLDTGNNIIKWLQKLMIDKNMDPDITLSELYIKTNVNLQIITTNLNKYIPFNFNHITTPNVKVLDAIRMSISIPLVFTHKTHLGDIHVDGCIINNYPIEIIQSTQKITNILGFKLINTLEDNEIHKDIHNIQSYIYNIFNCYNTQKKKYTKNKKYNKYTVSIDTKLITSLNLNLKPIERYELIKMGYDSLDQFRF